MSPSGISVALIVGSSVGLEEFGGCNIRCKLWMLAAVRVVDQIVESGEPQQMMTILRQESKKRDARVKMIDFSCRSRSHLVLIYGARG